MAGITSKEDLEQYEWARSINPNPYKIYRSDDDDRARRLAAKSQGIEIVGGL